MNETQGYGNRLSKPAALEIKQGALCISIDMELAWGYWDILTPLLLVQCIELERPIVSRLLDILERYQISATWAIVGRLLDRCPGHPADEVPAWFAPDIIEKITGAKTKQEVGCHSYEHIYFAENTYDKVMTDLSAARAVHERYGLEFRSFVFPRNQVSHLGALARSGIKVFRSVDQGWHKRVARFDRRLGRATNLLDKMLPTCPATVMPIIHQEGLVELPSSMLFMGRNGVRRLVHPEILMMKAVKGLRAAAKKKGIFHLWFHPSNFYCQTETQFRIFENVIREAARMRDQRVLDIVPMGDFGHV